MIEALKNNIPSLIITADPSRASFFTENPLVWTLDKADAAGNIWDSLPKLLPKLVQMFNKRHDGSGPNPLSEEAYNEINRRFSADQDNRRGKGEQVDQPE